MAKKKFLKENDEQVWPITRIDCVYTMDGSKLLPDALDEEFDNLFVKIEEIKTSMPEVPSIEGLATEEYVNNLNNDVVENINEINTELETKASTEYVNNMLSGLRLIQMTQSEYDALEVKDSNTLYIII